MNPFYTFIHTWLIGGLTYPALTFLLSAALKSSAIVVFTLGLTVVMRRKPALARLWAWRACAASLLGVLLWGLAPSWLDSWRMDVHVYPTRLMSQTVKQAQSLDILGNETATQPPVILPLAPLLAYRDANEIAVPLTAMRKGWMIEIEERVFHVWWSVALLLLAWRVFRAMCGHFWLRRHSEEFLNGTEHRLVRGLMSPVVTGWRKAQIWLPTEAAQWHVAKLRAVVLHEMAHHARHDATWQWLGWFTTAVWWWNPLAWLALSRLTAEAELSADESALQQNITATDYAQVLVEIAAGSELGTPAAGVAMLGRGGVKNRVKSLLRGVGRSSVFDFKARFALLLVGFAAVMAAGVEVRHVYQKEKPTDPLTEAEKALVERALAILETQVTKLARVHVKLTESWSVEGKEPKSSPRPSVIEAWVDAPAKQSRAEYRPRVTEWNAGAAPWYIKDETEATDGLRGWSYEGTETDEVRFSKDPSFAFFSFWESGSNSRELLISLQQMKSSGCKKFSLSSFLIRETEGRIQIERRASQHPKNELWEIDTEKRGLALYRETFPNRPEPYSSEWSVLAWGSLNDGTPYPARREQKNHSSDGLDTYTRQVNSIETIPSIPPVMLAPPEKADSPFVSKDGVHRHGEWLEARFVHAKTGKPVPEVKVHFAINQAERTELISDANGVLRLPLPKDEVRYLRYWGMKPGFVMQSVQWRRYGDPLNLPETYETKLFPAGKPIGGIIADVAGKPVQGAKVFIFHTGGERTWGVFADIHANTDRYTATDAQGKWSMKGFPEDLSGLSIRVEHPKYKRVSIGYEMASGQPLESLRDGTSRIVLKSDGLEVGGVISDTNGKPIPNCSVTITEDKNGRFDEPNAKTDATGRFAVLMHEAGKEWFTFEAPGFAPQMVKLDVNAESVKKQIVVTLRPGAVFKAQVVDEAGKPVSGVRMIADRWQEKRTLWFEGVTDVEGRLEWAGAPPDAVKWTFLSRDVVLRDLPLVADGKEHVVVLRPALRFTGSVVDAETGLPLKIFQVTPGDSRRSPSDIYWEDMSIQTFRDGQFTLDSEWMRFEHKLRISAEGYEPFETALFTPRQQTETLTVKLSKLK